MTYDANYLSGDGKHVPMSMYKKGALVIGRSDGEPQTLLATEADAGKALLVSDDGSFELAVVSGGGTVELDGSIGEFSIIFDPEGAPAFSAGTPADWLTITGDSLSVTFDAGLYAFVMRWTLAGSASDADRCEIVLGGIATGGIFYRTKKACWSHTVANPGTLQTSDIISNQDGSPSSVDVSVQVTRLL